MGQINNDFFFFLFGLLSLSFGKNNIGINYLTLIFTDSFRSSSNCLIAVIMPKPISTQFFAWFGTGSGQPINDKISCQ